MIVTQSTCLSPVDFDSEAFGLPFYRLTKVDKGLLTTELEALCKAGTFAADGKFPSNDLASSRILMECGFRKVCMQITLAHNLEKMPAPPEGTSIVERLDLSDEDLLRHARNFTADRFALDPLLPAAGHDQLYVRWLRNSVTGAKQVAHIGRNVCTFAVKSGVVVIDLVSILDQRQGIGSRLIAAVLHYTRQKGLSSVRVTTECENTAAWSLYSKMGFSPDCYTACFHFFHPGGASG